MKRPDAAPWVGVMLIGLASLAAVPAGVGRADDSGEEIRPKGQWLTGQLLVATPLIRDPRFAQAVIYMVRHDSDGAMGVVVNRGLAEVPLSRLLEDSGLPSDNVTTRIRVHYGGPVERSRGLVLHSADYVGKGTIKVDQAVALTIDADILRDLATGSGPRRSLFALGYAGWAPNQLEEEIGKGVWVVVGSDESLVFDDADNDKWERAMARRGMRL